MPPVSVSAPLAPVFDRLATDGYAVAERFFPSGLCQALQLEAEALATDGAAIDAGIGRGATHKSDVGVRRARIRWVAGSSPAQAAFLATAENLRQSINELFYLGLFDFEAQIALTPVGGFYARHCDSFHGARNRIVSLVAYLNEDWGDADGGCLRIFPPGGVGAVDIVPQRGTLVLMLSEDVPHEVLATHRLRASVAGWFRARA